MEDYMDKLLNEENTWDNDVFFEKSEGPSCIITISEVEKALKKTKKGKDAGPSGLMSEMYAAVDELGLEWLTDLCNKIVTEGKIPEDWKNSLLVPCSL